MTQKFDYISHYKIDAEEFDYFEERTGATEHDERRVHEFIIDKISPKPNNILDVGCGSAWLAKYYTDKNVNVVSLDLSKINVQKAKEIIPDKYHIPLVADSFTLPFKNNSFDFVVASEIIEHVIDPKLFAAELFRVIKPKGKLIITTPYKEKLRYYLCIHCNKKTPVHAHIHSFNEHNLCKLLIGENLGKTQYFLFGNKILIFLRTYVLLKFLPFSIWSIVDNFTNRLKNIPAHILIEFEKK